MVAPQTLDFALSPFPGAAPRPAPHGLLFSPLHTLPGRVQAAVHPAAPPAGRPDEQIWGKCGADGNLPGLSPEKGDWLLVETA